MATIRPMAQGDLTRVGDLAEALVKLHHDYNRKRFLWSSGIAAGYRQYFASILNDPKVILRVAEVERDIAGYAFATVEAKDWNRLLEKHVGFHDIFVDAPFRGRLAHGDSSKSVAELLVNEILSEAKRRNIPRVVLYAATENVGAQRLFSKLGFAPTMVEMTYTEV